MIKILLVEDQKMVLGALQALLNLELDLSVVACAEDGDQALAICANTDIDIVISDIEMPNKNGLALAQLLQQQHPLIKTIMLTTFAKSGYLRRALEAKVKGYLLKDAPAEQLAAAVRRVYQGELMVAPELMQEAWQSQADPLSEKERQLLTLAHQGKTSEQIAKLMSLSSGTVRNYAHQACQKLGTKNRIEAANLAFTMGWL